jgi:hypothetical protein
MVGIRPALFPNGPAIQHSGSIEWNAWQARKVLDLIREAAEQLPSDQPRIICIETPNPARHLARAQNWITQSPSGFNAAVLLVDRQERQAHWVSRLSNPEQHGFLLHS